MSNTVELYEFQRILGEKECPLLKDDGPAWIEVKSGQESSLEDSNHLPEGWTWSGNWKWKREIGCDDQGFLVQDSFLPFYPIDVHGSKLRRRKWIRNRIKSTTSATANSTTDTCTTETSDIEKHSTLRDIITKNLQSLSSTTGLLIKFGALVGTNREVDTTRDTISSTINSGESTIVQLRDNIHVLKTLETTILKNSEGVSAASLTATRKKLNKDFLRQEDIFGKKRKEIQQKMRNSNPPKKKSTGHEASGAKGSWSFEANKRTESQIAKEQTQVLDEKLRAANEIEINTVIMEEREEALRGIAKDLHQVEEIMTDLAVMVKDQDTGIQQVAVNAEKANERTKEGLKQLEKADEYQQNGRCIIS